MLPRADADADDADYSASLPLLSSFSSADVNICADAAADAPIFDARRRAI